MKEIWNTTAQQGLSDILDQKTASTGREVTAGSNDFCELMETAVRQEVPVPPHTYTSPPWRAGGRRVSSKRGRSWVKKQWMIAGVWNSKQWEQGDLLQYVKGDLLQYVKGNPLPMEQTLRLEIANGNYALPSNSLSFLIRCRQKHLKVLVIRTTFSAIRNIWQ